jgi:hypothetical protein
MFSSHRISQDIPHLEQVVVYCDYSLRNHSEHLKDGMLYTIHSKGVQLISDNNPVHSVFVFYYNTNFITAYLFFFQVKWRHYSAETSTIVISGFGTVGFGHVISLLS